MSRNIGTIGSPSGRLLVWLLGRDLAKIELTQLTDSQRLAGDMPIGGRVAGEGDLPQLVGRLCPCLVRSQDADPAEHQPARAAFFGTVLYKIAGGATRLHAYAKPLDRAVTDIPYEQIAAGGIGSDCIDEALGQLRHHHPHNLLPRNSGEAGGKQSG